MVKRSPGASLKYTIHRDGVSVDRLIQCLSRRVSDIDTKNQIVGRRGISGRCFN